jgi:hypothetical protein
MGFAIIKTLSLKGKDVSLSSPGFPADAGKADRLQNISAVFAF